MRDRRNANLSVSSISSTSSTASATSKLSATESAQDSAEKAHFLWFPPPADNGLPSPLVKHARQANGPLFGHWRLHIGFKQLFAVVATLSLYVCYRCFPDITFPGLRSHRLGSQVRYNLVGAATLPEYPSTLVVKDELGTQRWTVSIPESYPFPLQPNQYIGICKSSVDVGRKVAATKSRSRVMGKISHHPNPLAYEALDHGFLDVDEVAYAGVLPLSASTGPISVVGDFRQSDFGDLTRTDASACETSLTFVLETDNAGFGNSLLALWLSYGLAKKEGRAFFLDDSRWPYGEYLSYFPAPPLPSCSPPPSSHVVPCPQQAKHLVVSVATMPWTLDKRLNFQSQNRKKTGMDQQLQVFNLLRTGYEELFALIGEDANFLTSEVVSIKPSSLSASVQSGPVIGMHIRRGDRHPFEFQFSHDYLPLDRFTAAVTQLTHTLSRHPNHSNAVHSPPTLLLASDDPDILISPDLLSTLPPSLAPSRAQSRIVLASKRTLAPAVPLREPGSAYTKHVDENSGWEGGFYSALFYSLGRSRSGGASGNDNGSGVSAEAKALRTLVGRAYLLDLAVLAHSDAVVCAISSATCRILAVMMGWEKVVRGDWVNVDDGRVWSWDGRL